MIGEAPYTDLGEGEGVLCGPHVGETFTMTLWPDLQAMLGPCKVGDPKPTPWWALHTTGPWPGPLPPPAVITEL